jgi:uncharacterized protein YjiS (DUF1127 family)
MEDLDMQTIDLRAGQRLGTGFGGALRVVAAGAWNTLRVWMRILRTRQGLEGIDDRMLHDLGISRAQADFQLTRAPWTLAARSARR